MTKEEKNQPVTFEILGKFTEEVLLPAVKTIVEDSFKSEIFKTEVKKIVTEDNAKLKYELKDYIDSKLAETKGDIMSCINRNKKSDKNWKLKTVEVLKNNKLAKSHELQALGELI